MFESPDISIRNFKQSDLSVVKQLIHATIDACYSSVYPAEAIQFFKDFHSDKNISNDADRGFTIVLEKHDRIIGTGTIIGDHIFRVFVDKSFQKCGYGKLIMSKLEEKARSTGIDTVILDSSLVSKRFYDDLDYETVRETLIKLPNGKRLDYYEMARSLKNMES